MPMTISVYMIGRYCYKSLIMIHDNIETLSRELEYSKHIKTLTEVGSYIVQKTQQAGRQTHANTLPSFCGNFFVRASE